MIWNHSLKGEDHGMAANVGIQIPVDRSRKEKAGWQEAARKAGLFILFLLCAIAVFVFGSNYYSIFPTNKNVFYELGLVATFLIAALLLRRGYRYRQFWPIVYAFFVASSVILVTTLTAGLRDALFRSIGLTGNSNQVDAAAKVFEALITITIILLLSRLAGMSLESLYIKRGHLKWGLILGFGLLVNFASSALMFFSSRYSNQDLLGDAILWGLVFSLANGYMEEVWLRGQFLRKLAPLSGSGTAIVLTSLWWALFHIGAVYMMPAAIPFYMANLFTFGLAYGYVMQKTDSWIAPGLMHAASDFFLFIAMLSGT